MKHIDIIVPVFNEQECLERFYTELATVLAALPHTFRVIFIDDGSVDGTPAICSALAEREEQVGYLRLSRNFGHQAALTAGLDVADGDAAITLDADLQHPPSTIPSFIEAWQQGFEIVSGVRQEKDRLGLFKRLSSALFYRLLNALSDVELTPGSPDFRLYDHKALSAIRLIREQSRFLRGISAWVGFRHTTVPYEQPSRYAGTAKYGVLRMFSFGLSALVSFSRFPLRFATYLGSAVSLLAFIYGIYALAQKLVFAHAVPGWTSLAVLFSFLSGIQLLAFGVLGEYLGQVLEETKRRPLYVCSARSIPSVGHD